jgi:hypothetical protein
VNVPALSTHLDDYVSLVLGLAILSFGLVTLRGAWRTRRWPATDGRILSASTEEASDEDGKPLYQSRIAYEYQVGTTIYRGDRTSPGPHSFGRLFASSTQAIGGHLEGRTCRVYYDPARPERAVLIPGPTLAHYAVTMLGALFVASVLKNLFLGEN